MAARGSVLLYNFTDKARTDKVKFIFVLMGIKIRSVAKEDYLQPIGALSGVTRIERTEEVYEERALRRRCWSSAISRTPR